MPRRVYVAAPDTNRHERAIANTLKQADAAAANGDYRNALSWLGLIEAIGDELPQDYQAKRQAWHTAIAADEHSELGPADEPPRDAQPPTRHDPSPHPTARIEKPR